MAHEGITVSVRDFTLQVIPTVEIMENLYQFWKPLYNMHCSPSLPISIYSGERNGHAFGCEPAKGSFPGQERITGYQGQRLVNSKRRNLGSFIGELQSDPFVIQGERIDFLIGGGNFPDVTCINLFVKDGETYKKVRTATGECNLNLIRKGWDVSEFKGREAFIQILDYAPVEKWGFNTTLQFPEDDFGFILVDDIRQTDYTGRRVCEQYDRERNFDFETVRIPRYPVTIGEIYSFTESDSRIYRQIFTVGNTGRFTCTIRIYPIEETVSQLNISWFYEGEPLPDVKLGVIVRIPISIEDCQYFMIPGLLYNGNPIGEACHYLGEDFPEDTSTIPAGFTIENEASVFGGWVKPRQSRKEPMFSVRLQKNYQKDCYEAVYLLPESAQFGRRLFLDLDRQFFVTDGWNLEKVIFLYHSAKEIFTHISNKKQGFGQVINTAWHYLYPSSPTHPPHSLATDYRLRLNTLLDPYGLMQEVEKEGRKYRLFYVGRWTLPDSFDFSQEKYVPKKYFHAYVGFSWSGHAGLASYMALKTYFKTKDKEILQVAEDTLDFFVNHGMSSLGVLCPVYHEAWAGIFDKFGTYFDPDNIDMGPLGEALYWYIKCYCLLRDSGISDKKNWLTAVRSSLDAIMQLYPDGDIPGRINRRINSITSREGVRRYGLLYWAESKYTSEQIRHVDITYTRPSLGGPTNFIYLIRPYIDFAVLSGEEKYLKFACKIGEQVIRIMETYGVFAGSEMDFYNIDKRQGHALLAGFNRLFEVTNETKWLEAARLAANYFASWQYAFNVPFDGLEHLPLGRFDYHTIGGTPVDIKYSTNNLAYEEGAAEFLKLWSFTGEEIWFERARALLHQSTQSTLTEEKRLWLNSNYQGPGLPFMRSFNPNAEFDKHCIGGGTEDVLPAWPYAGHWTSKHGAILSMYMLAQGLVSGILLEEYGSIIYDATRDWAGAIDTIEVISLEKREREVKITVHNMINALETYLLKIIGLKNDKIEVQGQWYNATELRKGIPISLGPYETQVILIKKDKI